MAGTLAPSLGLALSGLQLCRAWASGAFPNKTAFYEGHCRCLPLTCFVLRQVFPGRPRFAWARLDRVCVFLSCPCFSAAGSLARGASMTLPSSERKKNINHTTKANIFLMFSCWNIHSVLQSKHQAPTLDDIVISNIFKK